LPEQEIELAMESIERSAKVQTLLVNDILELSRIRMGKLRLEVQPVCVSEIMQSAIQTIVPAATAKGIKIDAQVRPSIGPVLADPDRLHQVVWNLLSNAIKFTPSGGTICALVSDKAEQAEIVVADTGDGIDASFLPKVFARFEQAGTGAHKGGLGLGLAIVKELVELHGGNIQVASKGIGLGTKFTVLLPKLRLPAIAKTEDEVRSWNTPPINSDVLAGKLVLIVDDDAESRSLIEMVLKRHGAGTVSAESATEAMHLIRFRKPDVLVSDLGMPDVDGLAFIRQLRAPESETSSIPAVALSAYTREDDRSRALQSGFQIHLGKPIQAKELVDTVLELAKSH
jgi:CheY-like chemotaxis protein